ncbi:DUF2516 family protein [Kineococcus glutinatus]|uniref:DUF2516 family protein n=1 Tax=Kineococcus glutinatus TaxID=1070872 RepID=A0ABP9I5H2_9ACTN
MIDISLASVQGVLILILSVAALGVQGWALGDSLRHRPEAYASAGKLTKTKWVALLAVAAAIGVISLGQNFLGMLFFDALAVVAAVVYLTDARPALRPYRGRGNRGGHAGPYGPW